MSAQFRDAQHGQRCVEDGFRATVLPAIRAGTTLSYDRSNGRFQGLMAATTPRGDSAG